MQEAEILRREKELIATVLKQAEIERQRIETLAEAERQRLSLEAEGHAAATRAQGEAEAEIIFKKGEAEAKAMNVKAEAYQEWNQAAVVDKLITGHAGSRPRDGGAAREGRQDHHRLDRQRRLRGRAQDHRRHDEDGRAGAGAVRGALGHADVGAALEGQRDRRQASRSRHGAVEQLTND